MIKERLKTTLLVFLILSTFLLAALLWGFAQWKPEEVFSLSRLSTLFTADNDVDWYQSLIGFESAGVDGADADLFCPQTVVWANSSGRSLCAADNKTLQQAGTAVKNDITWLMSQQDLIFSGQSTEQQWAEAFSGSFCYVDFGVDLSFSAYCEGLRITISEAAGPVRYLVISSDESQGTVTLTIRASDGSMKSYQTAGSAGALSSLQKDLVAQQRTVRFGFEEPELLAQYPRLINAASALVWEGRQSAALQAQNPLEQSANSAALHILESFSFNSATLSQYTDTDGTLVYMENFRTLRIHPDGLVEFETTQSDKGIALSSLLSSSEPQFSFYQMIQASNRFLYQLNSELFGGTDADIRYAGMEYLPDQDCWRLYFDYVCDGAPIFQSNTESGQPSALVVDLAEGYLVRATLLARNYVRTGETVQSMAPRHALALAGDAANLGFGYLDDGSGGPLWADYLALS